MDYGRKPSAAVSSHKIDKEKLDSMQGEKGMQARSTRVAGETNASPDGCRGKGTATLGASKTMRARNIEGVHGRGMKMSMKDRMRRNESDEMRVGSIELIMMLDKSLSATIMVVSAFRGGQPTKFPKLISNRKIHGGQSRRGYIRDRGREFTVLREKLFYVG